MVSIEHDVCRSLDLYEQVENFAGMKPEKFFFSEWISGWSLTPHPTQYTSFWRECVSNFVLVSFFCGDYCWCGDSCSWVLTSRCWLINAVAAVDMGLRGWSPPPSPVFALVCIFMNEGKKNCSRQMSYVKAKWAKIDFFWLCPWPRWWSLLRSPDPLDLKGPTS